MKIGIDISAIPYGTGVSRYTANLVSQITKQLNPDETLNLFGGALRQYPSLKTHAKYLTDNNHSTKSALYPMPPRLSSYLFNQLNINIETLAGEMDIFHAWDWYIPQTKSARLITTIHDMALFRYPETAHPKIAAHHQESLKRIAKLKAQVIAVSQATKKDIIELTDINPDKIQVIHEALPEESKIQVNQSEISQTLNQFNITEPYMLAVSTLEPRKNLNNIIKAWRSYKKDFQLVIAGKQAWDNLEDEKGLIKIGYVSGKQLAALYQSSACFIYASLYEGFGLPILEAFYHQTPVVTSNISSMPEVAGTAAILVDPQDTKSISQAIDQALSKRDKLVKDGVNRLNHFSWEKAAKETLELYRKVSTS